MCTFSKEYAWFDLLMSLSFKVLHFFPLKLKKRAIHCPSEHLTYPETQNPDVTIKREGKRSRIGSLTTYIVLH